MKKSTVSVVIYLEVPKSLEHTTSQDEKVGSASLVKPVTSSMHQLDMTSLAKLNDKGVFEDSNATCDEPADDDSGTTKPKHTVPYPESVVRASSLELDEHVNFIRQYSDCDRMKNVSSSNRSPCVDIDDIVINIEPSMLATMKG